MSSRGQVKPQVILGTIALVVVGGACDVSDPTPRTHPFVTEVDRPAGAPLFDIEADGVRLELYDRGDCALIIETVPDYGILVDEVCPTSLEPPAGSSFDTPNRPVADFGDECRDWLPVFTAGRTVPDAAFVCVEKGRLEVRDGWWMTTRDGVGHEAFPLTADGVRLDSLSHEFDDRMRERCDAVDPPASE
jgi:hypothetical protein